MRDAHNKQHLLVSLMVVGGFWVVLSTLVYILIAPDLWAQIQTIVTHRVFVAGTVGLLLTVALGLIMARTPKAKA